MFRFGDCVGASGGEYRVEREKRVEDREKERREREFCLEAPVKADSDEMSPGPYRAYRV